MEARDLIEFADRIRNEMNLTQAEWSRKSGLDATGSEICRAYRRGNCKLSMMVEMLRPLGYELRIMKMEDLP